MAVGALNRIRHRVYRAALNSRENLPTVKPRPFLDRYSPRMSSPPQEAPQVSTRPLEKPARMPPTRQLVSISGMMGSAGMGMMDRNRELDTVHKASFATKVRPMVL